MSRSNSRSVPVGQEELEIELEGRFYPLRVRKLAQSRSIAVSADTVKG